MIESYIPAIQEVFRRNGFPLERFMEIPITVIGPTGISQRFQQKWEYKSKDEQWSILVNPDGVVLQTTNYDRFDGYAEKLRLAVDTVLKATDHDRLGVLRRVGIRYVNLIRPQAGEDFRAYVAPGFHGLQEEGVFQANAGRLQCQMVGATRVGARAGTLAVRVTQNDRGEELPPDLLEFAPLRTAVSRAGELLTIVDMDHALEGRFDCDVDWIVQNVNLLHTHLESVFFEHVVTPHAWEVWS